MAPLREAPWKPVTTGMMPASMQPQHVGRIDARIFASPQALVGHECRPGRRSSLARVHPARCSSSAKTAQAIISPTGEQRVAVRTAARRVDQLGQRVGGVRIGRAARSREQTTTGDLPLCRTRRARATPRSRAAPAVASDEPPNFWTMTALTRAPLHSRPRTGLARRAVSRICTPLVAAPLRS